MMQPLRVLGAILVAIVVSTTRALSASSVFDRGVQRYEAHDYAGAAQLFRQAAEGGDWRAQLQLGYQYEIGQGVPRDYRAAAQWYERAARTGNAQAQKNLGTMYERGLGVDQDWVAAAQWYQRSAARGNADGETALARAYRFGIGVPQDRGRAIEWYRKAAARGDATAAEDVRWLQQPGNAAGFMNQGERTYIIGVLHRYPRRDPRGLLFHNRAERVAYLAGQNVVPDFTFELRVQGTDKHGAPAISQVRSGEPFWVYSYVSVPHPRGERYDEIVAIDLGTGRLRELGRDSQQVPNMGPGGRATFTFDSYRLSADLDANVPRRIDTIVARVTANGVTQTRKATITIVR
jgi:hypothetical protein